jgi:HEAT repeat protein
MRIMKDRHSILGLVLVLSFGSVGIAGADLDRPPVFAVTVEHGALTVDVRGVPLALVLQAIGEWAGIDVRLDGELSAPVTQSFTGLPLEEGIRRLARGHSVLISYGPPTGESAQPMVTGVRILVAGVGASRRWSDAAPSRDATPSSLRAPVPATSVPRAEPKAADLAEDSSLALRIAKIQDFANDAGLGSEAAMSRLVEIAASETDAGLREQAVAALGRLTDAATEPALVAALSDADVSVRVRAVRGLRTAGTDTAAASLADVLIVDADPQVRLTALAAVGSLSGPRVPTMLQKASTDPDVTVRETALRWLAWWKSRGPATP